MKRWLAFLMLPMLLLGGCRFGSDMASQVVVTGIGIDYREGRYLLSIQAVEALKISGSLSEQSEAATTVYTAEGGSVAEALQAFLNETGKNTYILQNRILVLGGEACRERSLFELLDYFIRNREGHATVDVILCDGDPTALLSTVSGSDAVAADYVSQLLEEGNRRGQSVSTCLSDIERASSGMYDAVLPILRMEGNTPTLAGTALFRSGEFVGEMSVSQTRGLLLSGDTPDYCVYTTEGMTVRCEDIATDLTIKRQGDSFWFTVTISAQADIVEGGQALSKAERKAAVKRAEEAMAAEVNAALRRAVTECGSDPLLLARTAAAQYRSEGVTQVAAQEMLTKSRFTVQAKLELTSRALLK